MPRRFYYSAQGNSRARGPQLNTLRNTRATQGNASVNQLRKETCQYDEWVRPSSLAIFRNIDNDLWLRCRFLSAEKRHQVVRRFLHLEFIKRVLLLPSDLREYICSMWNFRDFTGFYAAIAKQERSTYYNHREGWSDRFTVQNNGLGGIQLSLDPWDDEPLLRPGIMICATN